MGERARGLGARRGRAPLAGGTAEQGAAPAGRALRALTADVALLVLDEPGSGLDRDGEHLLAGALRAPADAGAAVVVSTHARARAQLAAVLGPSPSLTTDAVLEVPHG